MHETQSGVQPHIWLVEDDEDMVTLLRFYLEREGYRVTSGTDGRLAKDAIPGSYI
jgi:DNA-binding response OmpR family regulator